LLLFVSSNSSPSFNSVAEPSAIAPFKPPRHVLDGILAFPPNRHTLGGTAYLLQEAAGNILIDCPAWDTAVQTFIQQQGGIRWLFLTHRNGSSHVRDIQQAFGCEIVVQEQEAYLLPGLAVTTFQNSFKFSDRCWAIWTPGYSPGSACLYSTMHGGVLFSGRHLLPNQQGEPVPLRISKTFHWKRQIQSVQRLLQEFTPETLRFICPAANIGFLHGQRTIEQAYQRLAQLDLQQRLLDEPGL
jgi:glyoxylase-like metal-dependent hydrolase (beta-lactamase superfamily II)